MRERVLIVGSGGREHAIGWKIKQSKSPTELFIAPGNTGTSLIGQNVNIAVDNIDGLRRFASDNNITLTIIGPEAPLEKGIVNGFNEDKLKIFGPTKEAALLETSKSWAIEFMQDHNIPHPRSRIFNKAEEALSFVEHPTWKEIVIKADGLAGGKGVILPSSLEEAKKAIRRIMIDKEFDDGEKIVIQERLKGKEVSLMCITDGKTIVPLLPVCDHKRLNDDDKGPNTGGMGAFAPATMNSELLKQIYDTILRPTVDGMRKEGHLFQGVLFAGLMLTADGPKVLEFNVRFGDPEAQVLMMLWKSDLLTSLKKTIEGRLSNQDIIFRRGASVCIVLAAEGYPESPIKGDIIHGLDKILVPGAQIFQAGTKLKNGQVVTDGGRVLGIAARGKDIRDARGKISPLIGENGIHFRGMHYRRDIGHAGVFTSRIN